MSRLLLLAACSWLLLLLACCAEAQTTAQWFECPATTVSLDPGPLPETLAPNTTYVLREGPYSIPQREAPAVPAAGGLSNSGLLVAGGATTCIRGASPQKTAIVQQQAGSHFVLAGGRLRLESLTLQGSGTGAGGGVVMLSGSQLAASGVRFAACTFCGGVRVEGAGGTSLRFQDVEFLSCRNAVDGLGGALSVRAAALFSASFSGATVFRGNRATRGGAVYVAGGVARFSFANGSVVFDGNTATVAGGALAAEGVPPEALVFQAAAVVFKDNRVSANATECAEAPGGVCGGGALALTDSVAAFNGSGNVSFSGNVAEAVGAPVGGSGISAAAVGGAVAAWGSRVSMQATACFSGNGAVRGAAVWLASSGAGASSLLLSGAQNFGANRYTAGVGAESDLAISDAGDGVVCTRDGVRPLLPPGDYDVQGPICGGAAACNGTRCTCGSDVQADYYFEASACSCKALPPRIASVRLALGGSGAAGLQLPVTATIDAPGLSKLAVSWAALYAPASCLPANMTVPVLGRSAVATAVCVWRQPSLEELDQSVTATVSSGTGRTSSTLRVTVEPVIAPGVLRVITQPTTAAAGAAVAVTAQLTRPLPAESAVAFAVSPASRARCVPRTVVVAAGAVEARTACTPRLAGKGFKVVATISQPFGTAQPPNASIAIAVEQKLQLLSVSASSAPAGSPTNVTAELSASIPGVSFAFEPAAGRCSPSTRTASRAASSSCKLPAGVTRVTVTASSRGGQQAQQAVDAVVGEAVALAAEP